MSETSNMSLPTSRSFYLIMSHIILILPISTLPISVMTSHCPCALTISTLPDVVFTPAWTAYRSLQLIDPSSVERIKVWPWSLPVVMDYQNNKSMNQSMINIHGYEPSSGYNGEGYGASEQSFSSHHPHSLPWHQFSCWSSVRAERTTTCITFSLLTSIHLMITFSYLINY